MPYLPPVKNVAKFMVGLSLLTLAACSTVQTSESPNVSVDKTLINKVPRAEEEPPMTSLKSGKELKLVRIMEGGACKNEQEGAKGGFLLYAAEKDIERIKAARGAKAFAEFEKTITDFSLVALQTAVTKMNFSIDASIVDPKKIQQNRVQQFTLLFQKAIAPSITHFQTDSTLTIDVQPFASELVFYQHDCEATKGALENEQETPAESI